MSLPQARCFLSASPSATRALAAALAPLLPPGCLLRLEGDLGAGKTTFVQGLARGLGVAGPVQSPTFTLIREHAGGGGVGLAHMDFYRLSGAAEAEDLGLDLYLDGQDILAVEWPVRAGDALPCSGLVIALAVAGGDAVVPSDVADAATSGPASEGACANAGGAVGEPPRLIRFQGLDPAATVALHALAVPVEPGLDEVTCPSTAVDHA